jgi:hypothetical protein
MQSEINVIQPLLLTLARCAAPGEHGCNKRAVSVIQCCSIAMAVFGCAPPIVARLKWRRYCIWRRDYVGPSKPETANELIGHPRRIGAFAVTIAAQHAEELCETFCRLSVEPSHGWTFAGNPALRKAAASIWRTLSAEMFRSTAI